MSNYSEDGRDICAAGDLRGEFLGCSFSQYRMERGIKLSLDDGVLSILLTDAQDERIVAAKDAEIAEWREQRNDLIEGNNLLHAEIASERELRRQLASRVHELKDAAKDRRVMPEGLLECIYNHLEYGEELGNSINELRALLGRD